MTPSLDDPRLLPPGSVALVGAGPGDPDLLTLAALKMLRAAEVVIHDALVSQEVLEFIPPTCERIPAGKRGGRPSANQKDICDIMVSRARAGKRVVRLKGGDPFVFGRGGEEAERLSMEGIPFRVVPGLTSGIAGPAYAGIPVTHRSVNANLAFVTGHESAESSGAEGDAFSRIDWESIGRAFPVLVLYMAMKNLETVAARLMAGGREPHTPLAVIRWATTPQQETLVTTLEHAARDVTATGMGAPSIIVVGNVVNYRETLAWFPDLSVSVPPSAK